MKNAFDKHISRLAMAKEKKSVSVNIGQYNFPNWNVKRKAVKKSEQNKQALLDNIKNVVYA